MGGGEDWMQALQQEFVMCACDLLCAIVLARLGAAAVFESGCSTADISGDLGGPHNPGGWLAATKVVEVL